MNLIFLGPPGSGKGTQSMMLEKKYNIPKLSTGDMLRKAVAENSLIGQQAKIIMDAGEYVPDNIMIEMISERINLDDCKGGFILDGFPRTIKQAEALDEMLAVKGKSINAVLELKIDDTALIDRISGRYSCKTCDTGYNSKFKKTIKEGYCDDCGGTEFIYREDDKAETVAARLRAYNEQTSHLLLYYNNKKLLHTINGMADIEVVSNQINLIVRSSAKILT
jgi:adenylate kinase